MEREGHRGVKRQNPQRPECLLWVSWFFCCVAAALKEKGCASVSTCRGAQPPGLPQLHAHAPDL